MNPLILILVITIAIILAIVALVLIFKSNNQPVTKTENISFIDFEDLMVIVKNPTTSSDKLLDVLQKFNENFLIDESNEQKYLIFFSRVLTHKNVNKEIFQYFHKEIKSKNIKYKKDLDVIERKALG